MIPLGRLAGRRAWARDLRRKPSTVIGIDPAAAAAETVFYVVGEGGREVLTDTAPTGPFTFAPVNGLQSIRDRLVERWSRQSAWPSPPQPWTRAWFEVELARFADVVQVVIEERIGTVDVFVRCGVDVDAVALKRQIVQAMESVRPIFIVLRVFVSPCIEHRSEVPGDPDSCAGNPFLGRACAARSSRSPLDAIIDVQSKAYSQAFEDVAAAGRRALEALMDEADRSLSRVILGTFPEDDAAVREAGQRRRARALAITLPFSFEEVLVEVQRCDEFGGDAEQNLISRARAGV